MGKGIKIRKIRIEDVSEIVSIQESILQIKPAQLKAMAAGILKRG
jgi:hypothetical protein